MFYWKFSVDGRLRGFLAGALVLMLACTASAQDVTIWPDGTGHSLPNNYEARITALMATMDNEDKVGQLVMGELKALTPSDVRTYRLGAVLNGGGTFPYPPTSTNPAGDGNLRATAAEWLALAQAFHDASINHAASEPRIPVLWGTDAVHGHNNAAGAAGSGTTLFPHNIGLGATNNPDLMEDIGEAVALEVAASGIFWTFAPTIAVPQNDRWGRTYEGFSEDPRRVSSLGAAMIKGLQGTLSSSAPTIANDRVAATAKHFVGDGGTDDGVDRGDTTVDEAALRAIHGEPYVHALDEDVLVVMASFNRWNGDQLHGHKYLLTDVLKGRLGFQGFVLGDWDGHAAVPGCNHGSCANSINAGVDMIMVPNDWRNFRDNTLADVEAERITQERLDDAVRRILRVKFILGLFGDDNATRANATTPSTRANAGDASLFGHSDHRAVARQAVRESLVLLKNNDETLPIRPSANVLVVGNAAQSIAIQSGGWSIHWQGGGTNEEYAGSTTMYGGIEAAVQAGEGTIAYSADGTYQQKPEVAIVFFGEDSYAEGEGDIQVLRLSKTLQSEEDRLKILNDLRAEGIAVVSVYIGGRPLWLTPEINASDAFVAAWLPGTEGAGVADVLFCEDTGANSDCNFSGTLPFSWPRTDRDFHQNVGQEGYEPLFEVGYGLNYAQEHENLGVVTTTGVPTTRSQIGDLLFRGQGVSPYQLALRGSGPAMSFTKPVSATPDELVQATVIDYLEQEDAQTVVFAGGETGLWQLSRTGERSANWAGESDEAAVLIKMRVIEAGKAPMLYSLLCGEGCHATADISEILRAEEGEDWFDLSISLACLKKAGADLAAISRPVVLHTSGRWTVNIGPISLDMPPEGSRSLDCSG